MDDDTTAPEPKRRIPPLVRRWGPRALIGSAAVLVAIQFVPYRVENPSTRDEPRWDSARTEELFDRACADCHSNETNVLWFEHVAPLQWYIAHHVEEGREALNVSEWHTAAGKDLDELTEVIEEGEMPLGSYTAFGLHPEAELTGAERRELIDGLRATVAADPPVGSGGGRSED